MRVVIADDEYLARASLRSMLEELTLPLDFVGEATNGEEMIALVGQHLPDVAFVDIRMPRLNGLEAIRTARLVSPQTKWLILTGFPEFDYAREAIRLDVSDYLLKPVNPEELRRVLGDFIEENRRLKIARNKQFERELMALAYGLTSLEYEEPTSLLVKSCFSGALLYIDSHLSEKIKAQRQLKLCRALLGVIDQHLDNNNRIALLVLPGGDLAVVGAWEPIESAQAEQRVRQCFQAVEQEIQNARDNDWAITLLVSQDRLTYQELQDQLAQLQRQAPLRAVIGVGKRLPITLLRQVVDKPGRLDFSQLVLNICRCYQEQHFLNYLRAVQQLEEAWLKTDLREHRQTVQALADFFNCAINCPLRPDQDFKAWVETLQQHGEQRLRQATRDEAQMTHLIDQAIALVDENYMRNIGIGQIAERLSITPNYLSTLFHKKTGVNFMSYVKKVRLLKAQALLSDPDVQIQRVAEQVGYFSARHFSRLFAEQFGCLPSEYRDRFKNR